jgi:hypothetical protein
MSTTVFAMSRYERYARYGKMGVCYGLLWFGVGITLTLLMYQEGSFCYSSCFGHFPGSRHQHYSKVGGLGRYGATFESRMQECPMEARNRCIRRNARRWPSRDTRRCQPIASTGLYPPAEFSQWQLKSHCSFLSASIKI